MRSLVPFLSTLCIAAALAGCAEEKIAPTASTTGMPNPEVALRQSLDQVNADVGRLGTMGVPAVAQTGPVLPAELQREIALQWSGPLDAGVRKVANAVGYAFYVQGPPDPKPLEVSVYSYGQAISVLRALGDEAGERATVEVDPEHHAITVTHHV